MWEVISKAIISLKKKDSVKIYFNDSITWKFIRLEYTYGAIWFLEPHHVNNICRWKDEEYLHAGVVYRDEVHEQVNVSHEEHNQVNFLCFAW